MDLESQKLLTEEESQGLSVWDSIWVKECDINAHGGKIEHKQNARSVWLSGMKISTKLSLRWFVLIHIILCYAY